MRLKYSLASVLIIFTGMWSAYSSSVSIMIMQHSGNQTKVLNTSKVFEQSVLDYFYDAGFIVSNSPIAVASNSGTNTTARTKGYNDSKEGLFDYFIFMDVEINTDTTKNPDGALLDNINSVKWSVYSLESMTKTFSGYTETGTILKDGKDKNGLRVYSKKIAEQIHKELIENQKD